MTDALNKQVLVGSLANASRIARRIIPDLAGKPLYLVQPAAGKLATRELSEGKLGIFYPNADLALQPQLETEGKWQGRGVCVLVDAFMCFATRRTHEDGHRTVLGVVLHELTHWLDSVEPTKPAPNAYEDWLAAIERRSKLNAAELSFPPELIGHDETFIRLAAHIWWRQWHFGGECLAPHWMCFGNVYYGLEKLHSPGAYVASLEDELEALKDLPLRSVASIDPPEAFNRLWLESLERLCPPLESVA